MTPFGKFLKNLAEKAVGRFYEGPEAPLRLRDMVTAFANDHPRATKGEWVEFAAKLAEEAYKSGYVRGFEYTERTFDWRDDVPPEVLADWIDPSWKEDGRGISLREAGAFVPEEEDSEETALRRHAEEIFLTGARRSG